MSLSHYVMLLSALYESKFVFCSASKLHLIIQSNSIIINGLLVAVSWVINSLYSLKILHCTALHCSVTSTNLSISILISQLLESAIVHRWQYSSERNLFTALHYVYVYCFVLICTKCCDIHLIFIEGWHFSTQKYSFLLIISLDHFDRTSRRGVDVFLNVLIFRNITVIGEWVVWCNEMSCVTNDITAESPIKQDRQREKRAESEWNKAQWRKQQNR